MSPRTTWQRICIVLFIFSACGKHDTPEPPRGSGDDTTTLPFKVGINAHEDFRWKRWAEWSGRPVDVVTVFPTRTDGWAGITDYTWEFDNLYSFTGTMDFAVPFFPDNTGNLAECANGDYDEYWKKFGKLLVAHQRQNSYVRPAWEFNGNWGYGSKATDSALWIQSFRKVVTAIRSEAPDVKIEWVMNAHGSSPGCPPGENAWSVYPGDEYVDVIGIDSYDHYPASLNNSQWQSQCEDVHGICHVIEEARARHKTFSVPEWGVSSSQPGGGGDNAFYIEKMFELFKANADIMEYEAYFNDANPDDVRSELYDLEHDAPTTINPLSAAKYLELFGRK